MAGGCMADMTDLEFLAYVGRLGSNLRGWGGWWRSRYWTGRLDSDGRVTVSCPSTRYWPERQVATPVEYESRA